jgi:copper homeostasis protein
LNLEICVDNYESFSIALKSGADRIELCSSLREGGLTPSYAFMEAALKVNRSVFMMIRPRSCDFLYADEEIDMMCRDIYMARNLGACGVVFGVLTASGEINFPVMQALIREASGMQVTCHRAFDQVRDGVQAINDLIDLGVHRVLTSGQAENPYDGIPMLQKIVRAANNRIKIMAAGVKPETVREIILKTGIDEVHSAAMIPRKSEMYYIKSDAHMGQGEDFVLNIVDGNQVREIKKAMADF